MADDKAFEYIFEKIDSSLQFGWTQFLIHVRNGDVATVQKLISEGHAANDRNRYGLSALTVSVFSRNERMVETILNAPNFRYDPSTYELIDPVSLASFLRLERILIILLDKFPYLVNKKTPLSGYTPIFFAGIGRQYKIVEVLIERGADLRVRNRANQTIMEVATIMDDMELVDLLNRKSGVDDLYKPRCHPRLFTPPRCLKVQGVSPKSPKCRQPKQKPNKPYLNPIKKKLSSPISSPKPQPLRQINNILHNSFHNESVLNESQSYGNESVFLSPMSVNSSFSHSFCLSSQEFTPLAKSSIAFERSTLSNSFYSDFDTSNFCASPKLLSNTSLSSPNPGHKTYIPSPVVPGYCTYYHYPSPHYQTTPQRTPQNPRTPLINSKFPHTPLNTPGNFRTPLINVEPLTPLSTPKFSQSLMDTRFLLTPQASSMKAQTLPSHNNTINSPGVSWRPQPFNHGFLTPQMPAHHQRPSKSFVDSFATPTKSGKKKKVSLRTILLDKLYKREKLIENNENLSPNVPEYPEDLESVLEGLGLEKYHKIFEFNEVEPEILSTITDDDLQAIGIGDRKVRKLILKKIKKNLP